jgi:hypothetical protein
MNADPSYHLSIHNNNRGYALGCSSPEAFSPRLLADEMMNCADDQFMCWHACFNNTEELSPTACESRNLELACVSNVDGSIWDGETHSQEFEPACILADDEVVTDGSYNNDTSNADNVLENIPTATPNDEVSSSSTSPTSSSTVAGNWNHFFIVPVTAFLNAVCF